MNTYAHLMPGNGFQREPGYYNPMDSRIGPWGFGRPWGYGFGGPFFGGFLGGLTAGALLGPYGGFGYGYPFFGGYPFFY
ncbi:hypothetical protein ACQYAD_15220 [Neobacillus sp. SM06]|uniref:hypothetical protein n=1 Tax=Neobacillus sp. SM06 TaxID=3422492 RepID=UPI003D2B6DBD